jgi:hypothetical protein
MPRLPASFLVASYACATLLAPRPAGADEGMWLLNNPPTARLKAAYGFEPSPQWLEHMQKSAVRFSVGGSGSIVSADGLVMTNHHVGSDVISALSTPERNYMRDGFYARTRAEELKAPDLELDVLWTIQDVTEQVNAGITPGAPAAEAEAARRKAMTRLEQEGQEKSGLLCQVVTLYQGGRYHLYGYKRYTDVRLVFAPDEQTAAFGGDPDNFEYPRFCLDCCFFRIYENGQPLRPEHHLAWGPSGAGAAGATKDAGAKENDLVFVFGHPGRTRRLYTVDHLRFLRDVANPWTLRNLWRSEVKLENFAATSEENARTTRDDLLGVQNSRKHYTGLTSALQDPATIAAKAAEEQALRSAVARDPAHQKAWGEAWDRIAQAEAAHRPLYLRHTLLTRWLNPDLLKHAITLVRLVDEKTKPSAERLREFADAALPSLELGLFSPAPIYDARETELLSSTLSAMAEYLGADDPLVVAALAGESPRARAEEIVRGTTLKTPDARRALAAGGQSAIKSSTDPLIALARAIDPEARAARKQFEDTVESVERESYAKVAAAKFAAEGENVYPDATFTLRLAYGAVKGYEEDGKPVPAFTTIAGLFQRADDHHNQPPYSLPERWAKSKDRLKLDTPYNFVSTCDIIGGNSGSPVVDRDGRVVGLVFDGNIQSLSADVVYDSRQGRAVAVDARGLLEALRVVYGATSLVEELTRPDTAVPRPK